MADGVTRNDIPDVEAIKEALLAVLASGRGRAFDNIAGDVAKQLGLTRAQRSYRIGKSKDALFANRLVQARSELTKEGAITYRSGKVKKVAQEKCGTPKIKVEAQPSKDPAKAQAVSPSAMAVHPGAPEGRPTKCLSFQEPYASYIATGVKDVEFRSKRVNVPIRDLVVCASKTPKAYLDHIPALAYGLAIGMVDVVECIDAGPERAWKLENPRMIKPFEVHATAGFFYVADIPEVIPATEEAYREHVLPLCFRGDRDFEDEMVASLFSAAPDEIQRFFEVDQDRYARVKRRHR